MPKPKRRKQAARLRLRLPDFQQITTRQSPEIVHWLNETAAELNVSRDNFLRLLFGAVRESMQAAKKTGTTEASVFDELKSELRRDIRDVVREQFAENLPPSRVRSMLRAAGGPPFTPNLPRST